MARLERHHIVYRSQGGLDFELNYKYLTPEEHRGDNGPHKCREVDRMYKIEMQEKLEEVLVRDRYNVKDLILILGLKEKQANRKFRWMLGREDIGKDEVIKKLMGGRFYK